MTLHELPQITVTGTPQELGHGQGEAFRDMIQAFVPMRFEAATLYLAEAGRGDLNALRANGRQCFEIFRGWDPDAFDEHCAVAEAAHVDPIDLFTAANMTDMRDVTALSGASDEEGCTSLMLPTSHSREGMILAGQTWDLNPQDIDYVVAIHRLPSTGVETWSVTVSGCPTLVGMNADGRAVGTTNIKTWGSRIGVGYMNILHRALNSSAWDEAAATIEQAPRSGAHTYWMADPDHAKEWETHPDFVAIRDTVDGPISRTNHCLSTAHVELEWQPPSSSSSKRLHRADAVLAQGNHDVTSLQALFGDREDGVDSINRYAEDDQGTATNSTIVVVPARREFWACKGSPDRGRWQQLPFETGPSPR